MRWINFCCLFFLFFIVVHASLDPKQTSSVWPKCEPQCFQGTCVNGTCVCQPGWTGNLCENCFGRQIRQEPSGYLIDGPYNYSRNMRCTWLLDGTQLNATSVTLKLDQFSTECCWDHVYIYDGDGVYSKQLAALSGTMVAGPNGMVKEYVAHSGQAYLFFYSDLAYNMSGFNISYKFSSCPKDCSGRGTCDVATGRCHCSSSWLGESCEEPSCSAFCVNGKCSSDQRRCICAPTFRGKFCNITIGEAVWLEMDGGGPGGRASHGVALMDHDMWVVDGSRFGGGNFSRIAKLDLRTNVWTSIAPLITAEFNSTPRDLYDHSVVHYDEKLFIFGGVIENKNISCELWSFDLTNFTWELITIDHHNHLYKPYHVAGHTAHVVNGLMVVIFGYNPYRGYLDVVQEYNFSNRSWTIVGEISAYRPTGTYGHSSVLDEISGNIFVYGGYGASSHSTAQMYDNLYQYQPLQRKWSILRTSGYPTFLHTAALLNGMMIVVGGNSHNESISTKTTKCYSDVVLIYDIECGTWNKLDYPTYLSNGLARYGHSAVVYNENMYLYGGFNGNMLDEVIMFSAGNCSHYRERDSCLNSVQGSKCVWLKARCLNIVEADQFAKSDRNNDNKYDKTCASTGVGALVDCSEHYDCLSCASSVVQPCYWCNGRCVGHCAEGQTGINQWSMCPAAQLNCSLFHSCISCKLHDKCTWDRRNKGQLFCTDASTIEKPNDNNVKDVLTREQPNVCPKPCSNFYNCEDCSKASCLWCSTMGRCVDTNAYITSFPYGQCTQWSNLSEECIATENCDAHLTCYSCQLAGPRCGWCDDGSRTGLGRCTNGGANGPVEWNRETKSFQTNSSLCSAEHWFFHDCPTCQCNGHAVCRNDSFDLLEGRGRTLPCYNCSDETIGDQCETCVAGYFGNALNGGNCSACDCNNQATLCNPSTGRCHCTTKGVSGHNCDKCDQKYIGDPKNGSCYYELTVDFVFTFNLNSEDDVYITKISFVSRPPKENTDVTFKLTCNSGVKGDVGKVNLSINSYTTDGQAKTRKFLSNTACHEVERRFSAEEFSFGTDANTTFFVVLYDFVTPTIIQISFAQTATIDWMKFFVTFALCFFILLVLAFALWKIKQRVDLYRRRQRMFVEMAQMASRPFGAAQLDMTGGLANQKQWASAVAVEPCANYRAAVVTVALRLPTGGRKFAPNGQSGLAVASALVHITPSQLAQLQTPPSPLPEEKSKRRRPACIS